MTSLRTASAADVGAIAMLEAGPGGSHWTADELARTLAAPSTVAWVAEVDGVVRAHLLATSTGDVVLLATDPSCRRRGLARELLDACEAWWAEHGVAEAFLEVRADNDAARALYGGRGWTEVGRRRGYYRDGVDAVVLRWSASPSS